FGFPARYTVSARRGYAAQETATMTAIAILQEREHRNPDGSTVRIYVHPSAKIGGDASIGAGVRIEAFATIGDGASIGAYATIGYRALIGDRATIGDRGARIGVYATIENDASIGDNAMIGDHATI